MGVGLLQVRVSAGADPSTAERIVLVEGVPIEKPGNERSERAAMREAEKVRTRLLSDADSLKVARTKSTMGALLDRWLAQHEVDPTTRMNYESQIRIYIRPNLGDVPLIAARSRRVRAARIVLREVATLPPPLLRTTVHREAQSRRSARLLYNRVPSSRVPAVRSIECAPDPRDPQRRTDRRGALGLDHRQPDAIREAAGEETPSAASAQSRADGEHC
ncbi:MAG: hypothetical protein ACRDRX_25945 [Pseudonocardiaceae bacterium]